MPREPVPFHGETVTGLLLRVCTTSASTTLWGTETVAILRGSFGTNSIWNGRGGHLFEFECASADDIAGESATEDTC